MPPLGEGQTATGSREVCLTKRVQTEKQQVTRANAKSCIGTRNTRLELEGSVTQTSGSGISNPKTAFTAHSEWRAVLSNIQYGKAMTIHTLPPHLEDEDLVSEPNGCMETT